MGTKGYVLEDSSGYIISKSWQLGAGERLEVDAATTPHTDTLGALYLNLASATDEVKNLGLATSITATTGIDAYGIYNALTSSAVITGTNASLYGSYNSVIKSGADISAESVSLYGVVGAATGRIPVKIGGVTKYLAYY